MSLSAASVAVGLSAVSTIAGLSGSRKAAKAQKAAARAEARQLMKRADQEEAYGRREAIEITRQGEVMKSNARAAMVAGGGVSDDAGALELTANMDKTIDYNAYATIYEATLKAEDTRETAKVVRKGGRASAAATRAAGYATALMDASSTFSTYNKYFG